CVMYIPMMVVIAAALVGGAWFAPGNSYARPGHAIAHGAPAGGFHRSRVSVKHFRAARFGRSRHRNFGYLPYPVLGPDDCLVYDVCNPDVAAPSALPADWTASLARAPAANVTAPDCRWTSQTQMVPAEGGGERRVTITRCLSASPLSAMG